MLLTSQHCLVLWMKRLGNDEFYDPKSPLALFLAFTDILQNIDYCSYSIIFFPGKKGNNSSMTFSNVQNTVIEKSFKTAFSLGCEFSSNFYQQGLWRTSWCGQSSKTLILREREYMLSVLSFLCSHIMSLKTASLPLEKLCSPILGFLHS